MNVKKILLIIAVLFSAQGFSQSSLKFSGTNAYVTFGNNTKLGLAAFTLECWFQRQGAGATTSTGTGGITAIPLITKGRGEADGSNLDCNYFFGINTTGNVLGADFEEGSAGSSPGLNHPISGVTAIQNNVWYHGAVTYDGSKWSLYLNGNLEATVTVSQPVQNVSIQHSAIGSALTSTGVAQGFFNGIIDEVRIWNSAKTQAQIKATINSKIKSSQSGMVACWGLDENSGTAVKDTSGNAVYGTIIGSGYSWNSGDAPFNINFSPEVTIQTANNLCTQDSAKISLAITDNEKDTVTVKIYGRPKVKAPSKKFTIIGIPDTQFYTEQSGTARNSSFKAQTNWIVANKNAMNIVHSAQLGDCVQNGDNGGNDIEWKRADTSMRILEDTAKTKLKYGMSYTMNVGNHDQSPGGDAKGTTTFFNQYFGVSRFTGRNYWGGNYGTNNDNNYQLFSSGGIDFIAVSLEYDTNADTAVLSWANKLLKTYSTRKAIIVSHWIINSDGSFGAQGQAIYNALKANPNLMLMLCGHINPNGEARRTDVFNGISVTTLLSDYQDRTDGGTGWLRIMNFDPDNNTIDVKTYSPTLNQYETDANSQFVVTNLNLFNGAAYTLLDTKTIFTGNGTANFSWKNLAKDSTYEWYAEIKDRKNTAILTAPQLVYTKVPKVNLGADATVCNKITLNAANTGTSYLWKGGKTTQTLVADTSGTYFVKVTHPVSACTATDTIKLIINPLPIVDLGKDIVNCDKPVTLDAANSGKTILWSTTQTTQTILVSQSATINVKVTNPTTGCFKSDTIKITINPNPIVNIGNDTTVCNSLNLNAQNTGKKILWNTGSKVASITVLATGNYKVTVTDSITGCKTSDSLKVTVNPNPVISLGNDVVICGGPQLLNALNPGAIYLWSNGATSQTISASTSGNYSVKVTNSFGCNKSDTIKVTINVVPVQPSIIGITSYCTGQLTSPINATGTNVIWYADSTKKTIIGQTPSYYPQIEKSQTYYVTQTVNNCPSKIKAVDIIIAPYPIITITTAKTNYFDTDLPVDLTATPAGGTFTGKGVTNNKFYPAVAGIGGPYQIVYNYTSPFNCSGSEIIRLTVGKDFTSVKPLIKNVEINLYPNPAKDEMVLSLEAKQEKNIEVTLMDGIGKKINIVPVTTIQSGNYSYKINKQALGLSSGIYFIEVRSGNERMVLKGIFE